MLQFFKNDSNDLIARTSLQGGLPDINIGTAIFLLRKQGQVFTQRVELYGKYKISDNCIRLIMCTTLIQETRV